MLNPTHLLGGNNLDYFTQFEILASKRFYAFLSVDTAVINSLENMVYIFDCPVSCMALDEQQAVQVFINAHGRGVSLQLPAVHRAHGQRHGREGSQRLHGERALRLLLTNYFYTCEFS